MILKNIHTHTHTHRPPEQSKTGAKITHTLPGRNHIPKREKKNKINKKKQNKKKQKERG